MQRTFEIQLIKPVRARLVIDYLLDLEPLALDEPCDWLTLADGEWRVICENMWHGSTHYRCREVHNEYGVICMRLKSHIGPHVSGLSRYKDVTVWY